MQFDIVGLGVSTVDLFLVVDELPGTELVQKAHASSMDGGGPVATAMVAAARLGGRAAMLDRIGDDGFGTFIMERFRAEGVDTTGIVVERGKDSSMASILVRERDGARAITFAPGNAGDLAPAQLPGDTIRASRILHLNGRHWEASFEAARIARDAGVAVSFDGGAHRFLPAHRDLLPLVDICIVAEEYAAAFAGNPDPDAAAEAILAAGPRIVAITRGTAGSLVRARSGERFRQEAYRVGRVVDTTGAGDAYHGAFLFGLARGFSLERCARLAGAAGALNTRALGGRSALPTLAETEEFLRTP